MGYELDHLDEALRCYCSECHAFVHRRSDRDPMLAPTTEYLLELCKRL
jgi:predicted HNH restriction endonuclease